MKIESDRRTSYLIGEKVFKGRVNQHQTLIKKEPEEIYHILIDPEQIKQWSPFEQISVERITTGEFRVGTKFHFRLLSRIQLGWNSEVIHLEMNRQIVSQFSNGIFKGGIEIWDLKKKESGTEVTHTFVYKINRWIYKIGWYVLGGEKKHDELTELALFRLKLLLEKSAPLPPSLKTNHGQNCDG